MIIPDILLVELGGGLMACFVLIRAWRFVRQLVGPVTR